MGRTPAIAMLWVVALGAVLAGCATSAQLRRSDHEKIIGKTYVVTGASSGFGRGVAVLLGAHGANVVLAARRPEVLKQVAAEVEDAGGEALVVATDVSEREDVARLAAAAFERFGRIDVWINNAGVGAIGPFEDVPVEDHARVVEVNLNGVIYGSHAALRQFKAQGFGTLVNIGSLESQIPVAYHASYTASKHGVLGLGRALNEELRLAGLDRTVKVVTVMPWAADTPFWRHASNYTGREPTMVAMDDPEGIVEAIVWASVHPREELPVGWKARTASVFYDIFPDLTERIAANIVHKVQMEASPPAPPTSGALHEPMQPGTAMEGGVE